MASKNMASDPRRSRFPDLAAPLACALALWTVLTTVAIAAAGSSDLPFADDWEMWATWLRRGYSLGWFFSQLNDHRLVTTRLLFAVSH
ncbi:MAG TPA: hypothetical protein VKF41_11510, partial [Bryobacteraceae bacterium]|nr:hypothetical protein [Bryobacteraceae bacterium]